MISDQSICQYYSVCAHLSHWMSVSFMRCAVCCAMTDMNETARWICSGLRSLCAPHTLKVGMHAAPSLKQVHVHIISTDFNSVSLTTKKHWISFTHAGFFLDLSTFVIPTVQSRGQLD